jgi:hypothetical protein
MINYLLSIFKSKKYELYSISDGYFVLKKGRRYFGIDDIHPTGDFKGPMRLNEESGLRVRRFLNHYYKGRKNIAHWRVYDRMKLQLGINKSLYYTNKEGETFFETKQEIRERRLKEILNKN